MPPARQDATPASQEASALGTIGNYVLRARIGRGATSEVFAAEHRFLGDVAAVKLLRAELASDRAAIDEFIAEATKTRAIQHPSVVRVLDAGCDETSRCCYLVMERVHGESLAARLRREQRLPEAAVRALGAAIADGMQAVHDAGIVHRDLKPANVMLDGDRPKIVDFGIAKVLGRAPALATSRRVGTLAYMAPEQFMGGLIAPYVDVWALGVILFEAITGQLPFDGFTDGRCPQLFDPAPRAADCVAVSAELDRLIARCLERDPGRRPATMAEIANELRGEVVAERITVDAGVPATGPAAVVPLATPIAGLARSSTAPSLAPLLLPTAAAPAPRPRSRWVWIVVGGAGAGIAIALAILIATKPSAPSEPAVASAVPAVEPAKSGIVVAPLPITPVPEPVREVDQPEPEPEEIVIEPSPETKTKAKTTVKRTAPPLIVELRSNPAGAQILVDGRPRGATPQRLELAKPATITVRRDGYRPAQVRAKRAGPLHVKLVPCSNPLCEGLQ